MPIPFSNQISAGFDLERERLGVGGGEQLPTLPHPRILNPSQVMGMVKTEYSH